MAVRLVRHKLSPREDALAEQDGDAIDVAEGATAEIPKSGYYTLIALGACVLRIGRGLEDAAGGDFWPESREGLRYITKGVTVAVDAVA